MPGILAVFDSRGITDSDELLKRVGTELAPISGCSVSTHSTPNFIGVNMLRPFSFTPCQRFERDGQYVFLDGAFYDERPVDELLTIIFSRDPSQLKTLNGQFNAVVFNPARDELTVITDQLGTRPIYYWASGGRHVISSRISGIRIVLKHIPKVDPIGLIELFSFGHNIENRTVLDGISVLPPGSVTSIDGSGVQQHTYDEFNHAQSDLKSHEDWGDEISSCVKTIMPKYLQGESRKGIFLSGGLDSRIVAGAIARCRSATDLNAFTFGDPNSGDVIYGREIADLVGAPHHTFNFPVSYLSDMLRYVVQRSECAVPFYHASSSIFHNEVAQRADSIFVGFCGDNLSGGHLNRALIHCSDLIKLRKLIFRRALCAKVSDIERVFKPTFFSRYWPEVVEAFSKSVSAIDQPSAPDVADVWDMRNRQRRFTFSAPKVDRGRFEVVAPLLDRKFVKLMASMPLTARWKQLAYRNAIVKGFPELQDVPWAKTGRPIPLGRGAFWMDEGRRLSERVYQIGSSKLGITRSFPKQRFRNLAEDMRRDKSLFSKYLIPGLSRGSLRGTVFDEDGIRSLYQEHMSGTDHSHLLGTILTVQMYFDS